MKRSNRRVERLYAIGLNSLTIYNENELPRDPSAAAKKRASDQFFFTYYIPDICDKLKGVLDLGMADEENSYHKILGVAEGTSDEEIRKVYKRLALKYHPDKNKSPGAEEKFKEISEAYKSLLDMRRRRKEVNDKFSEGDLKRAGEGGATYTFHGCSMVTFVPVILVYAYIPVHIY